MKLETGILIAKGTCHVLVGATAPLGVGLAQWNNSGQWPPGIAWFVIAGGCIGGGANGLLAFLSTAYTDYKARNETDRQQAVQVAVATGDTSMLKAAGLPVAPKPPGA